MKRKLTVITASIVMLCTLAIGVYTTFFSEIGKQFFGASAQALIFVNSSGDGANAGSSLYDCDADPNTPGPQCTLRAAIQVANQAPGEDGIEISIPANDPGCGSNEHCTINLTGALPVITEGISITGPGAAQLTVRRDSGGEYPIFTIDNQSTSSFIFARMTIENGYAILRDGNGDGGAAIDSNTDVNLEEAIVRNSTGPQGRGSAIYGHFGVYLNKTMVVDNSVRGVSSGGNVDIRKSTVSRNTTSEDAAAIKTSVHIRILGSTISENLSDRTGTVINATGTIVLRGSTVVNNHIVNGDDTAAGLVGGRPAMRNSIVVGNTTAGTPQDAFFEDTAYYQDSAVQSSFNVVGAANLVPAPGDQFGITMEQLNLGPLQDNGGPTHTRMPGLGSAAIDSGTAVATDWWDGLGFFLFEQREFPRTLDWPAIVNATDGTDVGAVEAEPDADGDGNSDSTDLDDDNDGVLDVNDTFPYDPTEWADTDGDGTGNNAETDDDNDSVQDAADNCPLIANPDQADFDRDGIGDTCDPATGPPQSPSQCRRGGWARFDVPRRFVNRRDCIRWNRNH